jgi:uncharacterized membrane protein YgcG
MKNPWIIPAATLLVGAAGGYISGKGSESDAKPLASEENSRPSRSSNRSELASSGETTKRNSRATSFEDISKIPGNSARIQALMEYYAGLSPEKLADEANKLENLPMNERMMASFLLFGRWAEVDPNAAMAFSGTMGMAANFVRPTILQSWASVDPAGAAKFYAENPREFATMGLFGGGRGGQSGAGIIGSEWARQDPKGAMAWAASLSGDDKAQAMSSVIGEVAKTNPRDAASMIGQMDEESRGEAYRSVASQYGALDFAEAQTWIRSLPSDEQAAALAAAIGGLSNTDPTRAAEQVALMEAGQARDRVVGAVVQDLARVDLQAAADFLKKQDSENAVREGLRELMPTWTNQNPTAALAYANSFEEGPARDSALQSYVFSNTTSSHADLMKVASTIESDVDRDRSIGMTAMRWMREDRAAATAYVEASDLSDEAKERITSGGGMFGGRGGQGGPGGFGGQGGPGGGGAGGGNRRGGGR